MITQISIHAPSRERPLTGKRFVNQSSISIHAPSRERLLHGCKLASCMQHFNPRSLTGATAYKYYRHILHKHFNPRSLTGATEI